MAVLTALKLGFDKQHVIVDYNEQVGVENINENR